MISRLRPLELTTSFQERTYRLGETIDLAIKLTPRIDCEIREGRVDLVVEERWTERSMMTYEKPILQTSGGARGGVTMQQIGTETVTKEIVRNTRKSTRTAARRSWKPPGSMREGPRGIPSSSGSRRNPRLTRTMRS